MNNLDDLIDRALYGIRNGQRVDAKKRMLALVVDILTEAEWRKLPQTKESIESEKLIAKMKVSPAYSPSKNIDIMLWKEMGCRNQ